MVDKEFANILSKKISFELGSRSPSMREGIESIKREMSARGVLQSGMTFKKVADLCKQNIPMRAEIISETICNVVETSGIEYSELLGDHFAVVWFIRTGNRDL